MNKTTFMAKPGQVERKWYVVDATDVPLPVQRLYRELLEV